MDYNRVKESFLYMKVIYELVNLRSVFTSLEDEIEYFVTINNNELGGFCEPDPHQQPDHSNRYQSRLEKALI
jgi:hypothetical protein